MRNREKEKSRAALPIPKAHSWWPTSFMPYQISAIHWGPNIRIPVPKEDLIIETTTQAGHWRPCSPASMWTTFHALVPGCRMCLLGSDKQDFQKGCSFYSVPSSFESPLWYPLFCLWMGNFCEREQVSHDLFFEIIRPHSRALSGQHSWPTSFCLYLMGRESRT